MKKRFIAGARCPKCHASDTLRWWVELKVEKIECVDCRHTQQKSMSETPSHLNANQDVIGIFNP